MARRQALTKSAASAAPVGTAGVTSPTDTLWAQAGMVKECQLPTRAPQRTATCFLSSRDRAAGLSRPMGRAPRFPNLRLPLSNISRISRCPSWTSARSASIMRWAPSGPVLITPAPGSSRRKSSVKKRTTSIALRAAWEAGRVVWHPNVHSPRLAGRGHSPPQFGRTPSPARGERVGVRGICDQSIAA
jgi:hypothetical protein